jgi:hypothetical protein
MASLQKDALDNQIESFKYATSVIKIIFAILGVGIFMFSRYAFIFFSAAMLPSIAVIFADRAPHKCASATICTFNLIGVTPYLRELWMSPSLNEGAKEVISNPSAWLVIYITAFVGFIVYISLPAIIAQIYIAKANLRIANLVDHRNKICSEWDIKLEEHIKEDEEDITKL